MSARKRWATAWPQVTSATWKRHESKAAVYRYVNNEAANWACGALRSPILQVYVDEGNGWQLYERVDFTEDDPV